MKIKRTLLIVSLIMGLKFSALSDEGMWLPNLIKDLNYADMEKLGCKLTAEQIYSINNSSLKDAIFQLMNESGGQRVGFCTGEIVSPNGLMMTNHHCAYEAIAKLSNVASDYLTNGFWAMSTKEELPIPGLVVSRVVRIDDVTARVLKEVTPDMEESKRKSAIEKAIKEIEKEAKANYSSNTSYSFKVKEMFKGGEFYLFIYEIFSDVRLVGAPPSSIGKFGGDTDNWMWPRHTGDFSILRVYMSPDGKPAAYSKDNVPYKPLHYLPVSLDGVKEGDFTMIMGYPGQTERYITSEGMKYKMNIFNPIAVKLLGMRLEIMKKYMSANDTIRIAISDTYAALANGHKLFKGEAENLRQTDAIQQKIELEKAFIAWTNKEENKRYAKVLANIDSGYAALSKVTPAMLYASLGLLQGSQMVMTTQNFAALGKLFEDEKKNKAEIQKTIETLKTSYEAFFKEYFPAMDKEIFSALLKTYYKDIPSADRVKFFDENIMKNYKGKTPEQKIDAFIEAVYTKSIFTSKKRMGDFLQKPSAKTLLKDPIYEYAMSIFKELTMGIQPAYLSASKKIDINDREFTAGLRQFQPNRKFYPDANSTLRLTYGTVKPYKPRDAVYYHWITYIDGIIEKRDESSDEFKVPQKLVDLYNKKDYGQYADNTGKLPVAFISNNDITGGNSGSPIINARGEYIGSAFDGNWEWLCGNLIFNDNLQRTINVDARYVLWVIEKFAGAGHLIQEMKLVKNGVTVQEPKIL